MLTHTNLEGVTPKRIVILGSKGFVGNAVLQALAADNCEVLAISREQVDFCSDVTVDYLSDILLPTDCVVITAAKAPCKNYDMLLDNIVMMRNICAALVSRPVAHVIYISSDAVYTDSMEPLTERSPAAPGSLHGVMHLAREQMLASIISPETLLFLRPTLIYGVDDPHNGYGPNQFLRLAKDGAPIKLFGKGEEQRDHVHIDDVAEVTRRCIRHQSYGVLNVATGHVVSFHDIAQHVKQLLDNGSNIKYLPRSGPMPHNGYRAFSANEATTSLENFTFRLCLPTLSSMVGVKEVV